MYDLRTIKQEPEDHYKKARDLGKKQLLYSKLKGEDGFLPTLEEKLSTYNYVKKDKKSYHDGFITPRSIYGTYDFGRKHCFAKNFMPVAKKDHGDFYVKWENVYENIPKWLECGNKIELIEFLHKLYVVEGNKRTSVARYKNLPFVDTKITRLVPDLKTNNTFEVKIYHDFLEFEKRTNISSIWFSKEGEYEELEKYIDFYYTQSEDKYHKFVKEVFYPFKMRFNQLSKEEDFEYVGEIFLNYLNHHDLEQTKNYSHKDINKMIRKSIIENKKQKNKVNKSK